MAARWREVADSTFLITSGSTKGVKDDQGHWTFKDESVAFTGKGHHAHKYPVGHKAHSLRTVNGVPMVTIITEASVSDQNAICNRLMDPIFTVS